VATRRNIRRDFAPNTQRLQRRPRQSVPYKVITVGVYDDQVVTLDRVTALLQDAGLPGATRSFVVQLLVRKLQQEIDDLNTEQALQRFVDNYFKRPLSMALSREAEQSKTTPHQRISGKSR
jgi:hypothetical protein